MWTLSPIINPSSAWEGQSIRTHLLNHKVHKTQHKHSHQSLTLWVPGRGNNSALTSARFCGGNKGTIPSSSNDQGQQAKPFFPSAYWLIYDTVSIIRIKTGSTHTLCLTHVPENVPFTGTDSLRGLNPVTVSLPAPKALHDNYYYYYCYCYYSTVALSRGDPVLMTGH